MTPRPRPGPVARSGRRSGAGRRPGVVRPGLRPLAAAVVVVAALGGAGGGALVDRVRGGEGGTVAAQGPGSAGGGAVPGGSTALTPQVHASEPVTVADVVTDVRAVPVATLVDRDTVGPLYLTPADRAAGLLSVDVPESGSGALVAVPGSSPAPGPLGVRTVRVEVEEGLPVDGAAFAAVVMATLNDPRGWGARGEVSFARTDGPADVRVVLASPRTVDALCAPLDTGGQLSCGRNGHAALNARRWVQATPEFPDRTLYRQYLVNHEVGHLLGHQHEDCPAPGLPAPIMQQQSLAVAPCVANGWPFPQG